MQRLLGYVNWYGLVVPSLSSLIEPFQSLLSKNPPYIIDDAEKLITLKKKKIRLDITRSQPKSDLPFHIFVQTNDTNSVGLSFKGMRKGGSLSWPWYHKFKDQVLAKEADIKKLYAIVMGEVWILFSGIDTLVFRFTWKIESFPAKSAKFSCKNRQFFLKKW